MAFNMIILFTGTNDIDNSKVSFRYDDMVECGFTEEFLNDPLRTANILASNVENPVLDEDGAVEIISTNFNDSFADVMAYLRGIDYDEEDEDD